MPSALTRVHCQAKGRHMASNAPRNFTCPKCRNIVYGPLAIIKLCNQCGYRPPVRNPYSEKPQPTRTTSGWRNRCPHCLQSIPPGEVEIGQETDGRKGKYKCSNCLKWSDRYEFMEPVEWTQSACCSNCQSRDGQFVDEVIEQRGFYHPPREGQPQRRRNPTVSRKTVTWFACRDCGVTRGISWLPEKPDDPLPAAWTTSTGKPSSPKSEVVAQLSELSALWRSGALSDAEFEAAKKRILGLG